ncbi:MAG: 2-C-methyl-D-erythritol 2,4-cyclodiphosphate synthase [Filifactoraceae bacterium]
MRIGFGYDVHKLGSNRDLILGGVKINHQYGLIGHSDADVLVHSIMDAILGALALGDIGKHFPDTDNNFKNIDSRMLLRNVMEIIKQKGYRIGNIDSVIVAQKPKILPYIELMRENIAKDLECDINQISIKATTTERLGFEGREEGISSSAVALLIKN